MFDWLVAAGSVASLQAWAAMLFTYVRSVHHVIGKPFSVHTSFVCVRWYQGTVLAERSHKSPNTEAGAKRVEDLNFVREHRHRGQPYVSFRIIHRTLIYIITNLVSFVCVVSMYHGSIDERMVCLNDLSFPCN